MRNTQSISRRKAAVRLCAAFGPLACSVGFLQQASLSAAEPMPEGFQRWQLQVDGVLREALVYAPASAKERPTPVVFAFHGHGGSMRNMARAIAIRQHWPGAIGVFMQGLNTPGRISDPNGTQPGWQSGAGQQQDRDLKFFDAFLARLRKDLKVDPERVYATGHSNGGYFTYLLWAERGEILAALAASAATLPARPGQRFIPRPVLHLAGTSDGLVKYESQRATMEEVRRINGCEAVGQARGKFSTEYASRNGTPFVAFLHPGGHEFHPDGSAAILRFFQVHPERR